MSKLGKIGKFIKRVGVGAANFFSGNMVSVLSPVAAMLVEKMAGSKSKKKFEAAVFVLEESAQFAKLVQQVLKDDIITDEEAKLLKAASNELLEAKRAAEEAF